MFRKLSAFATAILLVFCFSVTVIAEETSQAPVDTTPQLNSKYAVVVCAENSQTVLSKGETALVAPAAGAKLMTAVIVEDFMKTTGRDPSSTTYTIPSEATKGWDGTSNIGLREGEELTISELLYALLVSNANDACMALAIYVAGSEDAFVEMMNNKAKELGADSTVFVNCTGLDASPTNNVTTAADMALILAEFYRHNSLVDMTCVQRYEMRATNKSSSRALNNKNHLVSKILVSKYYDSRAVGMMYTYTESAGHCIYTAVQQDELTFLVVLMGSESMPVSSTDLDYIMGFKDATQVFTWTEGFEYRTLLSSSELLGQVNVIMSDTSEAVSYHGKDKIEALVKTADFNEELVEIKVEFAEGVDPDEGLMAPLTKGQEIGTVSVFYDGKLMGETPLVLTSSVDRSDMLYIWSQISSVLFSRGMKIAVIVFVVLVALYVVLMITLSVLRAVRKAKRRKARRLEREKNGGARRVYYYVDDDDDEYYE